MLFTAMAGMPDFSAMSRSCSSTMARAGVGWLILLTHSSWLEKGPEDKLPSSSIAYQPGLMPRMSDLPSLM
jgi:hypothetical protein